MPGGEEDVQLEAPIAAVPMVALVMLQHTLLAAVIRPAGLVSSKIAHTPVWAKRCKVWNRSDVVASSGTS